MNTKTQTVACIGTGAMGFSTALCCAQAGMKTMLYGRSKESINKALENIKQALEKLQSHDIIDSAETNEIASRIEPTSNLKDACRNSDFLIESVTEDLLLKKEMFSQFSAYCPSHTIMGSNTSGLLPSAFSEGNSRAEQIIVMHFWNPAHLLPLVEIVPGKMTAETTVTAACQFITSLNKKPIVVKKEIPGFIGNRLQFALLREALYLLENGFASAEDIDAAVKYSFGRRLAVTGPLETADMGGLDIFYNITKYLYPNLCNTDTPQELLKELIEAKHLGTKSGKGIYSWEKKTESKTKAKREDVLINWLLDEE